MRQREFEITIGPDGHVEIHVRGYKGKKCMDAVKVFEEIVGNIQTQRITSEFYEPDEHVQLNVDLSRS